MAHGMIESIDISEAESMPGVIGIYTADSLGLEPTKSNFNPGVHGRFCKRQSALGG